ncbi:MAG: 23S rRNA (guanosine(2251)-2'-O)-methyltransferase RlmB [Candidatus Binatia bacterium]
MDRDKKESVIFGINPVREKLKESPGEILEVIVARGKQRPLLRLIDAEARRQGLPLRYVDGAALNLLVAGAKHQGVAARVAPYVYQSFAGLLEQIPIRSGPDWILALDGITDPRNLGALLRTAECAGIRHIVMPRDRSVGVTPTVVKASAGAVHYLTICQVTNLRRALTALKELGYWVIGLDAGAKESVYGRTYPERLVIVLGAEGTGVRPLIRQECDFLVSIPMKGRIASLNVAVAGGIFLYELAREKGF